MHKLKNLLKISLLTVLTYASITTLGFYEGQDLQIRLFGNVPLQNVSVEASDIEVIPGGDAIGIKLFTKGLLVVDVARFETEDGSIISPAIDGGLKTGDTILKYNDKDTHTNEEFADFVEKNKQNPIKLTIQRQDKQFETEIFPKPTKDNGSYKMGAWIRDSAAGIGTLTFYRKDNEKFVALGHGIVDNDVGKQYVVDKGVIQKAQVAAVVKGEKGAPGELKGIFDQEDKIIGNIEGNSEHGIYGKTVNTPKKESIKVSSRWDIKEGPATILCTIEGDKIETYNIEIQKVMYNSGNSSKSIIIKITDPALIDKTGGIVQGMSGSPIIQNNKLIGAVTHVFVNDPTRGYGIFAENMLEITQ